MNLSEIETKIKSEFDKMRDELERLFGTHHDVTAAIDNAQSAVIEHATSVPAAEGANGLSSAEPASDSAQVLDGGSAAPTEA